MKMVHKKSGKAVMPGDEVQNSRGEKAVVVSLEKPRHAGSTGRVYVLLQDAKMSTGYYPDVYGLEWVEREDRKPCVEVQGVTLNFDRERLDHLKAERDACIKREELIFTFDGAPLRVDYAGYLIQYLETRIPK